MIQDEQKPEENTQAVGAPAERFVMRFFWISWYQPTDDHRPLTFPPNKNILGWWCTGYRIVNEAATLVAMVHADNEEEAKAVIKKDWPEAEEWRFCDESDGKQPGDRFPLKDWMKERFVTA